MRFLFVVLSLLWLPNVANAVSAEQIVRIAPTRLAWLIALRQGMLESAVGIKPHPVTMAEVEFRIPPDIHPARTYDFGARFLPGTHNFLFNPKYYAALNRWVGDSPDSMLMYCDAESAFCRDIDHETGHAIIYDVSNRIGQMNLYVKHTRPEEFFGVVMILEGLSTYFERRLVDHREPHGQSILPGSWDDAAWRIKSDLHEICYEGGYWTVFPIVEAYGERGIEYILSHPLVITDGDAYTATAAYQQTALASLKNE